MLSPELVVVCMAFVALPLLMILAAWAAGQLVEAAQESWRLRRLMREGPGDDPDVTEPVLPAIWR